MISDGTAAFEARQETARRKADDAAEAGATTGEEVAPPLTDFERKLADTRRELQERADQEARGAAAVVQREAAAVAKMARLSVEFSLQADAIGYRPVTVVTARSEIARGFLTGRPKAVYRLLEVIGEGWVIADLESRTEWGSLWTQFIVMRHGPWIRSIPGGTATAHGEARKLPRGLDPDRVLPLRATRDEIAYVTAMSLVHNVEELLAKALLRAAQNLGT